LPIVIGAAYKDGDGGELRVKILPIGPTVRFAYQFAFGQLGTIIGLIWAPMVVIAVLRFLPHGIGGADVSPGQNPGAAGAEALRNLIFGLASLLLYAAVNVSVVRQALGLRKGGAVFHFALGRPEFRVFGASLLVGLILVAVTAASVIVIVTAAVAVPGIAGQVAAGAATLAALCAMLFVLVRLTFLYVPVIVAEEKVGLARAWCLTGCNFWRAGTVMFLVTLPPFAVVVTAMAVLMGRDFATLVPLMGKLPLDALSLRLDAILDRHAAEMIGINLIAAPFSLGLTLGAAAAGYRELAGKSSA